MHADFDEGRIPDLGDIGVFVDRLLTGRPRVISMPVAMRVSKRARAGHPCFLQTPARKKNAPGG